MPLQSLTGRKRRTSDESAPQQTPVRRRRVSNTCRVQHCQDTNQVQKFRETGDGKCGNQGKPGNFSLSSPTDVSDAVVVQQIRAKQAKASGLPNLSLSLLAKSIVAKIEEASELKGEVEAEALTPRPQCVDTLLRASVKSPTSYWVEPSEIRRGYRPMSHLETQ
ncbi:hypothetical protein GQ600_2173 [Phytophthora cactorum]|nr:hypothetical protein GQ600_2173 [Phytophthora cactorum]